MYRVLAVVGGGLSGASKTNRPKDDDVVDRMSHTYTVLMLLAFAMIVSTKHFVNDPIQCWIPAYFTNAYADYTNKICWVTNTYYSPFEADLPKVGEPKKELVYYQWVPLILIAVAAFFYLPSLIWVTLNTQVGVDVSGMISSARDMQNLEKAERNRKFIVHQFQRLCSHFREDEGGCCAGGPKRLAASCCRMFGVQRGCYLTQLYMTTKVIYLANAVGQFFLMNAFLGTNYHVYGYDIIKGLVYNEEWQPTPRFPRETLCDFRVRQLGNVHRYTVQCVLPINLFNEKIFVIIWFWLVFLILAVFLNLFLWIGRLVCGSDKVGMIKSYLKGAGELNYSNPKEATRAVKPFVTKYLKQDGLLVLRLIALNTNDLAVSEVVAALWRNFQENPPPWYEGRLVEKV